MKNVKYKVLSTVAFGVGCTLAGTLFTSDTFAIGNTAFTDENFYACVVKQFNALYPNEVTIATNPADTVLTDAQLAKMEQLVCHRTKESNIWSHYGNLPSHYELNGPKATSVAGLEKLTGLKTLTIGSQQLSSIDLSKNTNLTELWIQQNGLTDIDLSKNTKISHLGLHEPITEFDEPTLKELSSANLQGCNLSSIDISKNQELRNLFLNYGNHNLKELDASNNPNLHGIFVDPEVQLKVKPYIEFKQTDDCELAVKIPIINNLMTVQNTEYYSYDSNTSTITFKKKPVYNLISSSYFRTVQTGTEGDTDRVYFIYLPETIIAEYDKLENCVAKTTEKDIPVPDTAANTSGKSGIRTPDTGAMTGENNAKIIGISLLALSGVALVTYLASYVYHRKKKHIKF